MRELYRVLVRGRDPLRVSEVRSSSMGATLRVSKPASDLVIYSASAASSKRGNKKRRHLDKVNSYCARR